MLIIVIGLMILSTVITLFVRKDILSLWLCGLSASFVLMFSGVITYISKIGGYTSKDTIFLFLLSPLQRWLQFAPISLGDLGYIVALGRCLFPFCMLQVALESSMIPFVRRRKGLLRAVSMVLPVLFLIYYFPPIFRFVVKGRFQLLVYMIHAATAWILAYLLCAIALLLYEHFSVSILWLRRRFRLLVMSMVSISFLFGMYGIQDPAQIYNFYISEYLRIGSISYIKGALRNYGWVAIAFFTVFFVVLGTGNLVSYVKLEMDEDKQEMRLRRKSTEAVKGTSVFVHSIKNQLLAVRALNKSLISDVAEKELTPDVLLGRLEHLNSLNESMLNRVNVLYKSIQSKSTLLVPTTIDDLMELAMGSFRSKYPEAEIVLRINSQSELLVDKYQMAEALNNLMVNAWEAVGEKDDKQVSLTVNDERLYVVFEVQDNGDGIESSHIHKIYDPFFTTKNTLNNWGMGLHFTHQIVKNHLGMMRVESKPGDVRFFIMLPKYTAYDIRHSRPRKELGGERK